jgi:hypothetical protein
MILLGTARASPAPTPNGASTLGPCGNWAASRSAEAPFTKPSPHPSNAAASNIFDLADGVAPVPDLSQITRDPMPAPVGTGRQETHA